jgi:hypothetical protein
MEHSVTRALGTRTLADVAAELPAPHAER